MSLLLIAKTFIRLGWGQEYFEYFVGLAICLEIYKAETPPKIPVTPGRRPHGDPTAS